MEFTNKQLKEIEKQFDFLAGQIALYLSRHIQYLEKHKNGKILLDKLFKECIETFDMYREISAIACALQK